VLAKKVAAWEQECRDKPYYDEACTKKRKLISGEMGQFVALVNDELAGLRDISPDASADFLKEADGRRRIMELEVRNALQIIKCLGVPSSDAQRGAESAVPSPVFAAIETRFT